MKRSIFCLFLLIFLVFTTDTKTQRRRVPTAKKPVVAQKSNTNTAIVVDERLAVLRAEPNLFAKPMQRMRLGKVVQISDAKEADGVTFYRVSVPPGNYGWVQADAVAGKFKRGRRTLQD